MVITAEMKAQAFDLIGELGIVVEAKRFHACAQIGHPNYGYVRYSACESVNEAVYKAIIDCAKSYQEKNGDSHVS